MFTDETISPFLPASNANKASRVLYGSDTIEDALIYFSIYLFASSSGTDESIYLDPNLVMVWFPSTALSIIFLSLTLIVILLLSILLLHQITVVFP